MVVVMESDAGSEALRDHVVEKSEVESSVRLHVSVTTVPP